MKKLIVFIVVVILVCLLNMPFINNLSLDKIFNGARVEVYLADTHCVTGGYELIKNGSGAIVFCEIIDLDYIFFNYDVCGFTVKIENKKANMDDIIKIFDAKIINQNQFGLYGYSEALNNRYGLLCDENNFQLYQDEKYVLLGFPILLGGY